MPFDARWEVVPDNSVGLLGMEAGDYDIIEPTPQFVSQLEGNENICIEEAGFLLEPLHLSFNLNIPEDKLPPEDTIPADFFHDVRVRQAFNYAFDYDAYIAAGLEGNGATGTYLPPEHARVRPERAEVQPGSGRGRAPLPRERVVGPGLQRLGPRREQQPDVRGGRADPEGLARAAERQVPGEHPDRAGGAIRRGARHRAVRVRDVDQERGPVRRSAPDDDDLLPP